MKSILTHFERISLEEMSAVALLDRFDTKYLLPGAALNSFLATIMPEYSLLQVENETVHSYETLYYDTPDLQFYRAHHNRHRNRYKVRSRKYVESGLHFNEVKHKVNTGNTIKYRKQRSPNGMSYDVKFKEFVRETGCPIDLLSPQLLVKYNRMTLVHTEGIERLTIDTALQVENENAYSFDNLVIVEQKRKRGSGRTAAGNVLKSLRFYPSGFSKYCMGIAATRTDVKKNNFKRTFNTVEKLDRRLEWNN